VRTSGMHSSIARRRFVSRRSLPRDKDRSNLLPCSCCVRVGVSPEIVSKVTYTRPSRKIVSTHFTFHACSKNASFPRSSNNCHFELNVASALFVASRMGSSASSPVVGTCASRAGTGAASLAACTNAGEADGAGVRGLSRVALRLLGLCIASMSLSEKPCRSGMHDGSTKGNLSSKISTSLWYAISPVLGIQTLTRGEVA
jgi:hypothetical protein